MKLLRTSSLSPFKNLTTYFLFWMVYAWVDRAIFICFNVHKLGDFRVQDIIQIYLHGIKLDVSMTAYICALPFLGFFLQKFVPRINISKYWLSTYTLLMLFICSFITVLNVNIYREWGDKISKRVIDAFLFSPKEAIASSKEAPIFLSISIIIILWLVFYGLFRLLFSKKRVKYTIHPLITSVLFILIGGLLFLMIRGGVGRSTLNPSNAYYSEKTIYNHTAVNTHWALIQDLIRKQDDKNPYLFFENKTQKEILSTIFSKSTDSISSLLTTQRPNIVLIVLESFTADLIEELGGVSDVTPNINRLMKEGVNFSHIYAASDRSDKGIVGIFSGFPAQGEESIIKQISKHEKMPAIGQQLDSVGYQTSFYYGGQSDFYNFKSYMLTHGIHKVIDQADFPLSAKRSSWGVYDELVFDRLLLDADKAKQPFFSAIFTIINHEPFELTTAYKFGTQSNADKFKSTAYYTDSILQVFVEQCKTKAWYSNTLFVVVADHGHRLPFDKWELYNSERFHIPMFFFGPVIKPGYNGVKFDFVGNQTDLVATLLNQLSIDASVYPFSRNLIDTLQPKIGFFNTKNTFGFVTDDQVMSFDNISKSVNYIQNKEIDTSVNNKLLDQAKAYYQAVYTQYLKY